MKKIIISIFFVSILLFSSTTIVSSINLNIYIQKNELDSTIDISLPFIKNYFNYNIDNTEYSCLIEDYLKPIYFKTWKSNYYTYGSRSTIDDKNNHIYFYVSEINENQESSYLLKYNKADGSLIKSKIIESEYNLGAIDIVFYQDFIYLAGAYSLGSNALGVFLSKFDTNLDLLEISFLEKKPVGIPCLSYMDIDNEGIYMGGTYLYLGSENIDIFFTKYNFECEPVWGEPKIWETPNRVESANSGASGLTVCGEYVYMTGVSRTEEEYLAFILKYNKNDGSLVKQLLLDEDKAVGAVIKGQNEKIYLCSYVDTSESFPDLKIDLVLSVYDTNLNEEWMQSYDIGVFEAPLDMEIHENYIYLCGFDLHMLTASMYGFVFKCNINTGDFIWCKKIKEISTAHSIHVDNEYLYLSGSVKREDTEAYIMKCNHNGEGGKIKQINSLNNLLTFILQKFPILSFLKQYVSKNP